jgi:hypothetical protein
MHTVLLTTVASRRTEKELSEIVALPKHTYANFVTETIPQEAIFIIVPMITLSLTMYSKFAKHISVTFYRPGVLFVACGVWSKHSSRMRNLEYSIFEVAVFMANRIFTLHK